jgi:hypothetical protein
MKKETTVEHREKNKALMEEQKLAGSSKYRELCIQLLRGYPPNHNQVSKIKKQIEGISYD